MAELKSTVFILGGDGIRSEAELSVDFQSAVRMELAFLDRTYREDGYSVDECFTALRANTLEPLGMVLLINAARQNFHVSNMQRQMARGVTGYLLRPGAAAKETDQASIFDPCAPNEVCSIDGQAAFYKNWLSSLKD